jgi:hypothetical protein
MLSEDTMRSEPVFAARAHVANLFLLAKLSLAKLAAEAMRKPHRPSTSLQETMDDVFMRFSHINHDSRGKRNRRRAATSSS